MCECCIHYKVCQSIDDGIALCYSGGNGCEHFMTDTLIFKGKRTDNGKQVIGYYWCIEEHYITALSGKHFIKSLNDGSDYEVFPETVVRYSVAKEMLQ